MQGPSKSATAALCALMLVVGVGVGLLVAPTGDPDAVLSVASAPRGSVGDGAGDSDQREDSTTTTATKAEEQSGSGDAADASNEPDGSANAGGALPDDQKEPLQIENDVAPQVTSSNGGGVTERSYHWHYNLPAGNVLVLKEFKCPSEAPYIKSNGSYRSPNKHPSVQAWHIADMTMNASDGVGYANFNKATSQKDDQGFLLLTGWTAGSIWDNSIWAPPFDSATADLYVTCTSSADHSVVAYALSDQYAPGAAFPWGYH